MEMKDRIHQLMDTLQMNQQDFAAKLSISAASLSSIFTGRTNPTNNHVMAVHRAFPEVSVNWLMFGEGEMLVSGAAALGESERSEVVRASVDVAPQTGELPFEMVSEVVQSVGRPVDTTAPRAVVSPLEQAVQEKMAQPPVRKVKEIRIFYSDGTYESFGPAAR